MTFSIAGIGTALPEYRLTQDEAAELHTTFCGIEPKRARTLRALYRRSGVVTRHSVLLTKSDGPFTERQAFFLPAVDDDDRGPGTAARMAAYERFAPELALQAASRAVEDSGLDPAEVTHLVTVSCTGFVSPGVDTALIEGLGLSRAVERTHVGFMGCHGALNGLRVARSYVEQDPAAVPLLCAVELCSLHFSYGWDPDMLVANSLFADGAAAIVGRDLGPDVATRSGEWRVGATGTFLMEDSADAMSWRIGDHGFRMTLSARVPELIESHLKDWVVGWLASEGLTLEDVRSWAIHPGGPRLLTSVERALTLDRSSTETSRSVLASCGNMSSPTILFIIERMRATGADLPCVSLAFGPGLAVEATLFV